MGSEEYGDSTICTLFYMMDGKTKKVLLLLQVFVLRRELNERDFVLRS